MYFVLVVAREWRQAMWHHTKTYGSKALPYLGAGGGPGTRLGGEELLLGLATREPLERPARRWDHGPLPHPRQDERRVAIAAPDQETEARIF